MNIEHVFNFRKTVDHLIPDDDGDPPPSELIQLIEAEIERFPTSPYLYCLLGDIVQLGGITSEGIDDGQVLYERALAIDPYCPHAYESLAFATFLKEQCRGEVISPSAEALFEAALVLEQRNQSYIGLAEVLAEAGQVESLNAVVEEATKYLEKEIEELLHRGSEVNSEDP